MSNMPCMKIVKRPWNKDTKKWTEEYGAVWEKTWDDGNKSYSVKFSKAPPTDEFVQLVMMKQDKKETQIKKQEVVDDLSDEIPF